MKSNLLLFAVFFMALHSFGQMEQGEPLLIPQPVSLQRLEGSFILPANSLIETTAAGAGVAAYLSKKISSATGYTVTVKEGLTTATGTIQLNLVNDKLFKKKQKRL